MVIVGGIMGLRCEVGWRWESSALVYVELAIIVRFYRLLYVMP
jgi:hypothetical protein